VIGRSRVAHLERAAADVVAGAVEDDDAARPPDGEEARETVDELLGAPELAGVQEVVAVEEVEHR
jgi:hypothetical protein